MTYSEAELLAFRTCWDYETDYDIACCYGLADSFNWNDDDLWKGWL